MLNSGFERFVSRRDILGNSKMAEKLPVIIDNRGETSQLYALQQAILTRDGFRTSER